MSETKAHKKKVPEWLSTTVSVALIALLFVVYFVFYRPNVAVSTVPSSTATANAASAPDFSHPLTIGSAHLEVAFASTGAEQEQGLSDTNALANGQGMLFLFPSDSMVPFWMKDMNYPLDIIWIGSDKTVEGVAADLSPSTYPNTFSPKAPVRYALEVPAGFAKQNDIIAGTAVSF